MFQYSQYLSVIHKLPVVQKLNCNLIRCYSKSKNCKNSKYLQHNCVSKLLNEAVILSDRNNNEWTTTPYPTTENLNNQLKDIKYDASETSIFLFPGQGVVKVGDVKKYMKYSKVKELFEIASEILGYNLLKICLNGPQNILNRTEFNQPATVVLSLAALEKLQEERPRVFESCVAVAGYSVGELTALIFSGALTFEEGLKLVGIRAAAMQSASEMSLQGMLSCYFSPLAQASKICEDAQKWALDIGASNPVCRIAIYLYTQGKIFGGCNEALQYIEKNSHSLGLRKVQRLPVSGAFHTILMEPALKPFSKALNGITIREPNTLVYSNYSVKMYTGNEKMNKKYLINQIVSPVKWEQIIQKLYQRPVDTKFPRTFDIGSGGSMKTILKMINNKAADMCYIY